MTLEVVVRNLLRNLCSNSGTSFGIKGEIEKIMGMTATRGNVDLHEIPFAFECGRERGKGRIALQGGLTANIVDFAATSRTTTGIL